MREAFGGRPLALTASTLSQCRGAVDYSFRLLHAHRELGLHAVFRLLRNANSVFRDCIRGDGRDALVTVEPGTAAQREQAGMPPCRVRLVQYAVGTSRYAQATTLLRCWTGSAIPSAPWPTCTTAAGALRSCTRCPSSC